MPGALAHPGAVVVCSHGGQVTPTVSNPRVTVSGQPTVLLSAPWSVAGCPFAASPPGPCVTAVWSAGTARVRSSGQPLVIQGGVATCAPTGVPATVTSVQPRVRAT